MKLREKLEGRAKEILTTVLFPLVYWKLAPENRWWTFVKEGTAKVVVRGDKFEKVLIQWEGHYIDESSWDVKDGKAPIWRFGGLRWYGFWPLKDVYIYNFTWTGVTERGRIVEHEKERLDFVLLKDDVYFCKVENAEDKNLLPLDVELVLTIRVINPYKALFKVQNWLETVKNRIKPFIRNTITLESYEELITKTARIGEEIYDTLAREENGESILGEFEDRYGIRLREIGVKEINPPENYRQETLKKWSAERERERTLIDADAEAQRRRIVAQGEADRLGIELGKIQEFGGLGQIVRTLEMLEKSPGQGAKWVIPLPSGISDILPGIFPGRTIGTPRPEGGISVTPEELTALREELTRLGDVVENYAKKKEEETERSALAS